MWQLRVLSDFSLRDIVLSYVELVFILGFEKQSKCLRFFSLTLV